MKYLNDDLVKDKVKFIRKIRCGTCNFRICKINNNNICLFCLTDNDYYDYKMLKQTVLYHKYKGRTHGYVLYIDFDYCIEGIEKCPNSKLTHLTKMILEKRFKDKR